MNLLRILALLGIAACTPTSPPARHADVWLLADSASGVFEFAVSEDSGATTPIRVHGLSVTACEGDQRIVWRIMKEYDVEPIPTRFDYGVPPVGFAAETPAEALAPGCYRVRALGTSGVALFTVDSLGRGRATNAQPQAITRQSIRDSLVRALVIDSIRVRLDSGTATLTSVQAMLGASRIDEPAHHDDVAWTCYKVRLTSDSVFVRLESDELGGPSHWIGGFELSETRPSSVSAAACSTTARFHSVATDNGLFVGMPIADLLAIMHTPKKHAGGRYEFEYYRAVRTPGERPYDVGATLKVATQRGRVTQLSVWYAETS